MVGAHTAASFPADRAAQLAQHLLLVCHVRLALVFDAHAKAYAQSMTRLSHLWPMLSAKRPALQTAQLSLHNICCYFASQLCLPRTAALAGCTCKLNSGAALTQSRFQAVLSLELAPEAAAAHTAALASLAPACKGAGSMPIQDWGQVVLAAAEAELHHALQVRQTSTHC